MMKVVMLALAACLAAALLVGCTHAPAAYSPKNATETAVLTYTKAKISNLVVVNIEAPKPSDPKIAAMMAAAKAAHPGAGVQYKVTLSDPKDDSLQTTWMVTVDERTSQPIDQAGVQQPGPLRKVK
jgi:hypothetical protein